MKKNFIIGMSMLVASVAFVSCSKTDVFEENQKYVAEQEKSEYRTNYVKMYGEVSPNQSWDFSTIAAAQTSTRAGEAFSCNYVSIIDDIANFAFRFLDDDLDGVKSKINNAEVKEWNPYLAVELYPAYSYVARNNPYDYYKLAVCYNGQEDTFYEQGLGLIRGWRTLGRLGLSVSSKSLTTASNVYWSLYPTQITGLFSDKIVGKIEDYKIDSYKEFTVNGKTYWGFRVGPNGSYSDLICMVQSIDPVKPVAKRYFIEDLGSKKDFDFNDIVVDVYQAVNGSQKAIIRAMGGTIDFTLKIGDTEWTKSVQGAAAGYQVGYDGYDDASDCGGSRVRHQLYAEQRQGGAARFGGVYAGVLLGESYHVLRAGQPSDGAAEQRTDVCTAPSSTGTRDGKCACGGELGDQQMGTPECLGYGRPSSFPLGAYGGG